MTFWIAFSAMLCALIPCILFCLNLRRYVPPPLTTGSLPAVSILIPARDEAAHIEAAVRAALATTGCPIEVIVMDDSSTDATPQIVQALAAEDPRVRLEQAPPLPPGWNGKQHACWSLAHVARNPILCFVDADVRLGPTCIPRMAGFLGTRALVSGFPRQETGTWLEWMLLPLIHFVLLGFLPLERMRSTTDPAFAAGCGQLLMVSAEPYFATGGHSNIRLTMHDGLRLPRLLRTAGYHTDLADLTELASCRMYRTSAEVWSGLAKNATEGLGDPARIGPVSLALVLGQVLPFLVLIGWLAGAAFVTFASALGMDVHIPPPTPAILLFPIAILAAWLPRWLASARFRQDKRGALLHPLGIVLLLAVQWYALARKLTGGPVTWRNRAYAGE
jgi:hypothetical protein